MPGVIGPARASRAPVLLLVPLPHRSLASNRRPARVSPRCHHPARRTIVQLAPLSERSRPVTPSDFSFHLSQFQLFGKGGSALDPPGLASPAPAFSSSQPLSTPVSFFSQTTTSPQQYGWAWKAQTEMKKLAILSALFLTGCVGVPKNVKPVANFKLDKYLGQWYEIARLDHSFERGLSRVTATYSLRDDGGVRVLNRGYSEKEQTWKVAEGKAFFVGKPDQGYLKVSFFGPFYGSYVVFELDHNNYQYSLVCGPNQSYLWLLARNPVVNQELKDTLIAKAAALGFNTNKLIFVDHRQSPN